MAIIGILAAVTVPALPSILGGRGVQKAVGDVSGILELSRAEAMARRTYVYIGFANVTNLLGNSEIQIGAMSSLDGSTNTGTANLRPISKLIKVDRAALVDFSGLPSGVRSAASADIRTNSEYVTGPDFANTVDFSPIGANQGSVCIFLHNHRFLYPGGPPIVGMARSIRKVAGHKVWMCA